MRTASFLECGHMWMRIGLVLVLAVSFVRPSRSEPVVWSIGDGGNGHAYDVRRAVTPDTHWAAAREAARRSKYGGVFGHLATITTVSENEFIVAILRDAFSQTVEPDRPEAFWLGGVGDDSVEGWSWITDEPWNFTNWAVDFPNGSPVAERQAVTMSGWSNAEELGRWRAVDPDGNVAWYVVEYDLSAVDCNANGRPDYLDLAGGDSHDCNRDGVPDACLKQKNLILNGDFEVGTLDGWSVLDSGAGGFQVVESTFNPPGSDDPQPACRGLFSALSVPIGPGTRTLFQQVSIPPTTSVVLSWTDRLRNHAPIFTERSQSYRVEVWNDENQSLAVLFATAPGDPLRTECTAHRADLSRFAGQTVRIAFTQQDELLFFNAAIDDVMLLVGDGRDCNANGMPDACDIDNGVEADCDGNGIPDGCEDCNANGIGDGCDLVDATSFDCNGNAVPDECDIARGSSADCNANGVLDACELRMPFEAASGKLGSMGPDSTLDFTIADLPRAAETVRLALTARMALAEINQFLDLEINGIPTGRAFVHGASDCPDEPDYADIILSPAFFNFLVAELAETHIRLRPSPEAVSAVSDCENAFATLGVSYVAVRADCNRNEILDECDLADGRSFDCNGNGLPDECETDCNGNGLADECDVASGASPDCNANDIPDDCEEDCNANGVTDACDLVTGTSQDCDESGVPDECERDCNGNGLHDSCDIRKGRSLDCDRNNVPDECAPDCNRNGLPDRCDIADGTSEDCNANRRPDECELDERDCNENGVPDECDIHGPVQAADACRDASSICPGVVYIDSNLNAIGDGVASCVGFSGHDVWYAYTPDRSGDATISLCGSSFDTVLSVHTDCDAGRTAPVVCNDDACGSSSQVTLEVTAGVTYWIRIAGFRTRAGRFTLRLSGPRCRVGKTGEDCNSNGRPDTCDIADGTSADCNANNIPDACELIAFRSAVDACANAQPACPGAIYMDSTLDATRDGSIPCAPGESPSRWHVYTPVTDGELTASLCGSSYDTVLSIHSNCQAGRVVPLACNDDACGVSSQVSIPVTAGVRYYLRVSGYGVEIPGFGGDAGPYMLTLSGPACAEGMERNDCNANLVPDECDLDAGVATDADGNLFPDACQHAPGDADGDGDVDLADYLFFQACFTAPNAVAAREPACVATDMDGDLDVDLADLIAFQAELTGSF